MEKKPNLKAMFEEIERERGIKEVDLIRALSDALMSAAKKRFENVDDIDVQIGADFSAKIFDKKTGEEITPSDFGRVAAQTAKQVILQRLREAEKEGTFEEFSGKIGELITASIQQREPAGYIVSVGRSEMFVPLYETIPGENLRPHDKVRFLVLEAKRTSKGPTVVITRSHPDFIKKLFEHEIPEISQGVIEIKDIARDPGRRSKVVMISNDINVGVVGTCVGPMGSRIQNITKEVGMERIDIVEWSNDPKVFITRALSPAKGMKVEIHPEEKRAKVTMPQKDLSLAIGKEGQNVRLASKITGYTIDILPEEREQSAQNN